MNKSIRKVCFAVLLLVVVASMFGCNLINGSSEVLIEDNAFVAEKMDIKCVINDDYSYNIVQRIDVKFNKSRRGIIIDLPTNSGEAYTDIKVTSNHHFTVSTTDYAGFVSIKIGDKDIIAKFYEKYEVSYTMKTPKITDNNDLVYFNVLGNGWASKIYAFSADISFPTKADSVEFGMGQTSTPDASRFDSVLTDDKLTFSLKKGEILKPFNGISLRAQFPSGTFKEKVGIDFLGIVIASILGLALVYLLYRIFGREKPIVPVVNFAPPEGMSPAEMGAWIDGSCSKDDVISLIYYWASKGYITIFTDEDGDNVELRMVTPIDSSAPRYEVSLFNAMFSNRTVLKVDSNTVIGDYVVSTQNSVNYTISPKLFNSASKTWSAVGLFASVLLYGVGSMLIGLRVSFANWNFAGFFMGIFFLIVYVANYLLIHNEHKMKKSKFLATRYVLLTLSALVCFVVGSMTSNLSFGAFEAYSLVVCGTLMAFISPYIYRRSELYNEKLNQIVGFREFIEKAEVDKLKILIDENPQYYYDVLPYANVLGLTDVWADKFKSLTLVNPSYYRGNVTLFDVMIFNHIYRSSFSNINSSFTPTPSSSGRSGGGFSGGGGGGFSGGGFGGGGGRSW